MPTKIRPTSTKCDPLDYLLQYIYVDSVQGQLIIAELNRLKCHPCYQQWFLPLIVFVSAANYYNAQSAKSGEVPYKELKIMIADTSAFFVDCVGSYRNGKIFIRKDEGYATFVHELVHMVCSLRFDYNSMPYENGNRSSITSYNGVIEEAREKLRELPNSDAAFVFNAFYEKMNPLFCNSKGPDLLVEYLAYLIEFIFDHKNSPEYNIERVLIRDFPKFSYFYLKDFLPKLYSFMKQYKVDDLFTLPQAFIDSIQKADVSKSVKLTHRKLLFKLH